MERCRHWALPDYAATPVDEKTAYMITYGDAFQHNSEPTLTVLHHFVRRHLKNVISDVHLLPMYPWTSDDGFSVTDYRKIDPQLGDWSHIAALAQDADLMFDCVINHISQHSAWFQGFLRGEPQYQNFFIAADPQGDYHQVTRPRTLPLLTPFVKHNGEKLHIWTTFSADQIDLNFREPAVLLESIDILLEYAARGGRSIRLDAIGFIWKEPASCCIHLPQVHQIIQIWRMILDEVFPCCRLITETNVPHAENISYFGDGNEAQMVYQFPLPPLTLHAFLRGNVRWLRDWAQSLETQPLPENVTFFNFLASHDGIGLRPTEDLLEDAEREFIVSEVLRKQGLVSWKNNPDGSQSPYELNINFLSALSEPWHSVAEKTACTTAAHAILLTLRGVPAIYYHSLLGSENDLAAAEQSGINRRINRKKLPLAIVEQNLADTTSLSSCVFNSLRQLLSIRRLHSAFSPFANQHVLTLNDALFAVERHHPISGETLTCVVNVRNDTQPLMLNISGIDLLSNTPFSGNCTLKGWQVMWIQHTK
ncbi:sugar phosphorylase [Buttiauxella sp. 3AFRM03]|nr:sugar phosphorylase [Buttiauxella sp. 3AFRM03]